MIGVAHFITSGVSPLFGPVPSSINRKSFHPLVALYFSIVPIGTYSVTLLKTSKSKVLFISALFIFPEISNGFSISDITDERPLQPRKALLPIEDTLLGIVREVRP